MPVLGEFINSLAQKAGIQADNDDLKALLSSPELATINVADTLVTAVDNGLLSISAAKNNHPDIKKKYFADAFDGMDRNLIDLISKDTFDETDLAEIKNEKLTVKKLEMIVNKLKAQKAAANPVDKAAINAQIQAAHEAARLAKEEVENTRKEYEGKIKNIYTTSAIRQAMGAYKTTFDDLPADVRNSAIESIINKALQDKGAEFVADENGTLTLRSKDGSNVFGSNHVQLTPQSFLDQTLAPILKVVKQTTQPTPGQQPTATPAANTGDNAVSNFIKSHSEQVLQDMTAPRVSLM